LERKKKKKKKKEKKESGRFEKMAPKLWGLTYTGLHDSLSLQIKDCQREAQGSLSSCSFFEDELCFSEREQ
jgi:hypothetical protein